MRTHYDSRAYRRNRMERYMLVGGRCERAGCGVKLKGPLHEDGVPWQSHHVNNPVGDPDAVHNLRCLCHQHHNRYTKG